MICLLSDVHARTDILSRRIEQAKSAGAAAIIQVGDFGVWPDTIDELRSLVADMAFPVYFIEGNHEHAAMIAEYAKSPGIDGVHKVGPYLYYLERGAVFTLDGLRIGALGGAGSIDYKMRTVGKDFFPEEQTTFTDVRKLIFNARGESLDLLVTHTPPQCTIKRHFSSPLDQLARVRSFGVDLDWTDPSADRVEEAWRMVGQPPLICGHLHHAITDDTNGGLVRVLAEHEMIAITKEDLVWPGPATSVGLVGKPQQTGAAITLGDVPMNKRVG